MSGKHVTDTIRFMADDVLTVLPTDSASGHKCPICNGGGTGERSFSFGRTPAGIWYKCWRAKCGAKGFIEENGTRTEYAGPSIEEIKKSQEEALTKTVRFHIERASFTGERKFPIRTFEGKVKGVHLRRDDYRVTHIYPGEIAGGFFFPLEQDRVLYGTVVVVEDPISAQAVANAGTLAYCLFGTNLSDDKIMDIQTAFARIPRPVWLCLDKDATVKAAEYVIKYRLIAPTLKLMPIQKDLKHWSDEELRKFIYG